MPAQSLSVAVRHPLDRFDLDLSFETTHRVTGIFGTSGSGKTTLLETIAGLRRGASGRISLGESVWLDSGSRIWRRPEHRDVGYVPQESLLFPHLTVQGNLRAGEKRARRDGHGFDTTFEQVVRVLDIGMLLDRRPTMLSGGERQRVALGRALCSGPRLLLLDEPLASLDAGLRRKVLPFLHRVQSEFSIPMLLVSHNPVEVQALCDDLIVLREGRIIARGEPRSVLTRPEVFPLAEHEGFQNMIPGRLSESGRETSLVRIGDDMEGPILVTPRSGILTGESLLVGVPANEILLALERPVGLSARNIIPAVVERVQEVGVWRLISLRLAANTPPLVAEITADALSELHVEPNREVFAIIKTSAITLYEG